MAHELVKILTYEGGEIVNKPLWHWIQCIDARRSLCEGQAFGMGESDVEYETKTVPRGGITCPKCLEMIKEFKAIKL